MAKFRTVLFCERVLVDGVSNNVSLINILDEIHIPSPSDEQLSEKPPGAIPAVALKCAVVSFWQREKAGKPERKRRVRLRLQSPKRRKLIEAFNELDLTSFSRARLIATVEALPCPDSGTYTWRVDIETSKDKWRSVGSTSFHVDLKTPQEDAKPRS